MNILITGSTGFVGRHLVPELLQNQHNVLELTRNQKKSYDLYGDSTVKYVLDNNHENLKKVIQDFKPEIVIHLAAYLSSADDFITMTRLLDSNIYFLTQLLDSLKEVELKLFINTGTFAEYHKGDEVLDPAYLYAATKTASRSFLEYYSKVYHFKQITVVPYTIYGGRDSKKKVIDIIIDSMNSENPVDLTPGEQVLDFIHIDDVVSFYVHLVNHHEKNYNKTVFHLGTGKGTTIKELTRIMEYKTGKKANINWGGKAYRQTDVMYAVADIKTLFQLNWTPKILLSDD
jgi:nucleoside-diphosphate-sugar epimerase